LRLGIPAALYQTEIGMSPTPPNRGSRCAVRGSLTLALTLTLTLTLPELAP